MTRDALNHSCRAMLVSLGGSPDPVLYTLNQQQPEYILFFVSPQSLGEIRGVTQGLTFQWRDVVDRIVSPSAEILGDCYRALCNQLPSKLAQWNLSAEDVLVDYTGGTKSMSAAMVLATIEQAPRYSYVGGVKRDKWGVGIVLGGKERMHYIQNPWKEVAQEERKRVGLLFATARYATARQELQRMLAHVEAGERDFWQAMTGLARAMAIGITLVIEPPRISWAAPSPSSNPMRVVHGNQRWHSSSWTSRPIWSF